jgi:hypothetical protein
MASLAAPIVAAVAPLLIEEVVKLVDKFLGSKTGAVKLPTSTAIVQTLAAGTIQTGQAAGMVPSAETLTPVVQATVDKLNKQGVLKGADTVINGSAEAATLVQASMSLLTLALPKIA